RTAALSAFSLYVYGVHRHLHSFPTRRSSDLAAAARADQRGRAPGRGVEGDVLQHRRPGLVAEGDVLEADVALQRADRGLRVVALDRKSTRLNSSHVKISYAVFCLKKKKQNEQ